MTEVVFAVDLGGTKTSGALCAADGSILDTASLPTPGQDGPAALIGVVKDLAQILHDRAAGSITLRAVGIGTAGVVDVGRGRIVSATDTLKDWAGTEVASLVADDTASVFGTRVPVHVQNDVDAFAVGELRDGAAQGAKNALVIAVGTGIGASVIVDGEVVRGAHHVAGEVGHLPISGADHLRCPCGRPGHLEALASGVGMHNHYLSLGGDPAVRDGRSVALLAAEGDALALRAVQDSARAVGRGIAAVVTLLDPERVVVSGGVAAAGEIWWQPMEQTLRAELIDVLQQTPVVAGALGSEAPLRGAAASAWDLVGGQ